MILLDTTVLVYAVGEEHPLREPSRRILQLQEHGDLDAATTIEVIQEFAHVRARRRSRAEAVALARNYAVALRLIPAGPEDLEHGMALYLAHEGLGAFDAVLAAVALNHRAEALISADRGFESVPGLRWLDLAGPHLQEILR